MKRHTVIVREDHSRHKGHGQMTRYHMSQEEIEQRFGKPKRNEKEYKQRNYLRYQYKAPMREPTLEDQMSIYDLEGGT